MQLPTGRPLTHSLTIQGVPCPVLGRLRAAGSGRKGLNPSSSSVVGTQTALCRAAHIAPGRRRGGHHYSPRLVSSVPVCRVTCARLGRVRSFCELGSHYR